MYNQPYSRSSPSSPTDSLSANSRTATDDISQAIRDDNLQAFTNLLPATREKRREHLDQVGLDYLSTAFLTSSDRIALDLLVYHEWDSDLLDRRDSCGNTFIMDAARKNNLILLDALIKAGAREGLPEALAHAADFDQMEEVYEALIDLNKKYNPSLALRFTAKSDQHLEVFKRLLEAGASVEKLIRTTPADIIEPLIKVGTKAIKSEALTYAVECGHTDIAKKLINAGGTAYLPKALDIAAAHGHAEIVQSLLRTGTKTDLSPAVIGAATNGHADVVKALLEAGATGYLPRALEYAAQGGHTNVIKVFLEAKATTGLSRALREAVIHRHTETAKLLIDAGAVPYRTLAIIAAYKDDPSLKARALQFITAQNADASDALGFAADAFDPDDLVIAFAPLLLLGAQRDRAYAFPEIFTEISAQIHKKHPLDVVMRGAEITPALLSLVKSVGEATIRTHSRFTLFEDMTAADIFVREVADTTALLKLAEKEDTACLKEIIALSAEKDHLHDGWETLATRGYIDTIKLLISTSPSQAEQLLYRCAKNGNLAAAKTLMAAGVRTSYALDTTLSQLYGRDHNAELAALKLLIAAGADSSTLPEEISAKLAEENTSRQVLSTDHSVLQTLLTAAIKGDAIEVASMLPNVTPLVVLRSLHSQSKAKEGLRTLINAGLDVPKALLDCVRAGDRLLARLLANNDDASARTLVHLLKSTDERDEETARALIPAVTDGVGALIQAARSNDQDLLMKLLEMKANGPKALLTLLSEHRYEAAGRLIQLDVDVHTALMLTYQLSDDERPSDIRTNLELMGAKFDTALQRAFDLKDTRTAAAMTRELYRD
ncbi:ankyrin repeat domain-containing protein [Bordetella sp. 02P26C-1]|uniref:ankyrin repeat domain-containing protein n=1 Tax=Bordetella sp. 02P26C-1 TaxID=2683195 RepID=UPI001353BBBC|nr:ankyrin repeat domain-containing protein [Bordetella sp. 02P26C-1]MVW77306.1 hypothetical protein [Bordetella sp. 02P26C-1]